MKSPKFGLLFFTLSLLLFSCNSKKSNEVIISGKVEGVEDGIEISILQTSDDRTFSKITSDTIRNGQFHFQYIDSIPDTKKYNPQCIPCRRIPSNMARFMGKARE